MKLLKLKALGLVLLVSSFVYTASASNSSQTVDVTKSSVNWTGKKVGGAHSGTISIKEGNLTVSNGKITGGKIVIDMNSIKVTDITDPGMNAKLAGHLKSDDFFGVASYPSAELSIKKVEHNGMNQNFTGDLTIKGVTHPVSFTASSSVVGNKTVYKGVITVDRSKYNVRYGSNSFFDNLGDKVISDEFTLDFMLLVTK